MKCTLELYGKTYESTEFTERQVSLFLAASAGATGINIKDLFEELMGSQQMSVRGLREYSSLESAEKDLDLVLKRVFPTLNRSIESIDTTELITIVRPMLFALAGVEAPIEVPEIAPETAPTIEPAQVTIADKSSDLIYPPSIVDFTDDEHLAVLATSGKLDQYTEVIECWYQWWRSIADADGPEIEDEDAFTIIEDFSKGLFTEQESDRIASVLLPQLKVTPEPIAA